MFSIAEIQEGPDVKNISMFKAWWDILLDYLVAATALVVLLLLTRMSSVATGGIICVHPISGLAYGYVEGLYINSRCNSESQAWILIFHPYLMLFLWMCITSCHVCWIRIPSVNTKMETFYSILYKIYTTQPKFYRNPTSLRMATELSYNETNQKAIDVLLNKLLYLMTEKPFLRVSYMAKHAFIVIFSFISVCYAIFVIIYLSNYPSSFDCYLNHSPPKMRGYPFQNGTLIATPCHLNIAPFIYVLIHVDSCIRIAMTVLSLKGFIWTYTAQRNLKQNKYYNIKSQDEEFSKNKVNATNIKNDYENPFGDAADYLSGMPSYPDLLFCINLLKRNVHDGHLMYQAICTSIKNYVKKLKFSGEKYRKRVEDEKNAHDIVKNQNVYKLEYQIKSYHEYVAYLLWMCHELGLDQVPNSLDSNNLFEALIFIKNSLCIVDISTETNLRLKIVNHIRSHPELYKTLIDEDPDFDTYETHCDYLSKSSTFGSHYAIHAAATIFNVKIILIHCEYVIKLPEVYVPLRHNLLLTGNIKSALNSENLKGTPSNIPTRFLTYVAPHFYHATVDSPLSPDWPHIVSRRMNYSMDRKYRLDLRQAAIRSVILRRQSNTSKNALV